MATGSMVVDLDRDAEAPEWFLLQAGAPYATGERQWVTLASHTLGRTAQSNLIGVW